MKIITVLIPPMLFLAADVSAQETFLVNGLGTLSCGKVLESIQTPVGRAQVTDWLNGFVTGYNYYDNKHLVTPPDRESTAAFIEAYCREKPLSNIVAGAVQLVDGLGGKPAPVTGGRR